MQSGGIISRGYMFFDTKNQNLRPEVELVVFLRMRSNKSRENTENAIKMQFEGVISRACMFLDTRSPNLWSIFKPEVKLLVFLRKQSNKITKTSINAIKMQFESLISQVYMF